MITVTGRLEDVAGRALHKQVTFTSQSTPQAGASGLITGNTTYKLMTNASTGEFSVDLRPGNYSVSYNTSPRTTNFNIALSEEIDGETVSIEAVIETVFAQAPGIAPYMVWNGVRAGHVTFQPIDDAPAPTLSAVTDAGSHQSAGETYRYVISYVTPEGETQLPSIGFGGAGIFGTAGKSTRVSLEVSPERVTSKRIWRTKDSGDDELPYLLAEVSPATAHYDDWESHTDFAARAARPPEMPMFNTTAGIINASAGNPILFFSTSGMRCLVAATFDSTASFAGGLFLVGADGKPQLVTGASAGHVLTSDADGIGSWAALPTGDMRAGNYSGGQPNWTPSGTLGVAVDTSNGRPWWYYSGGWN